MLALSVMQPWAFLLVNRLKSVENRDWRRPPTYRGWLLIHAGLKPDRDVPWAWIRERCGSVLPANYPLGGIVGMARLVEVVKTSEDPWFCGLLGLVFEDAQPLPFTPWRGQLGFFKVDASQVAGAERFATRAGTRAHG